jgi:alpha-N-arabinofuranosidase
MIDTAFVVETTAPIGAISPRLYGHFAEHLGRCCYDGLFCDSSGGISQENGFRSDVLSALRALPVPLLRWPGGCYADHYHWRDGIGPLDQRPVRLGMSCDLQVEDNNRLGTHEFLWLCQQIGAEPYLAGNVGSGSPQELCDWLEYCNTPVATTLGQERAANGATRPFGVKLWGVGNENWGCGGNYDAAAYAREYVRYATMLRHVDPDAELVICGHDDAWNAELLTTVGAKRAALVDHLSIHRYWITGGPETGFSEEDYYRLLAEADATEAFVLRSAQILRETLGAKHRIGIALDEWGVWHPEARSWGPGTVNRREPTTYEQANTLRDALAAAVALEGFHRQCNILSLANLAQIVNVLQSVVMTEGSQIWLTPTYHALRLHVPHIGAMALPVHTSAGATLPDGSPAVSATASQRGANLAFTVVNRHYRQAATVSFGAVVGGSAHGQLLTGPSANAGNSLAQPDAVAPAALAVAKDGDTSWRIELPPHSMATVEIRA